MSFPVKTATTPGIDAAFFVAIVLIFACAYGDRTTAMCVMPGRVRSSVYLACPVISLGSSRRLMPEPKIREAIKFPSRPLSHPPGRLLDAGDDVLIAGAAAQIALQAVPDLLFGGLGLALEQLAGSQDHAGRAEAALKAVFLPEGFLHRMQLAVLSQAFDGHDGGAVGLHGQDRAGLDRVAVHQHRAGAALARIAADVGSGQTQRLAQEMRQEKPRLDLRGAPGSIDVNRDGMVAHRAPPEGDPHSMRSPSARVNADRGRLCATRSSSGGARRTPR